MRCDLNPEWPNPLRTSFAGKETGTTRTHLLPPLTASLLRSEIIEVVHTGIHASGQKLQDVYEAGGYEGMQSGPPSRPPLPDHSLVSPASTSSNPHRCL